MDPAKKALSLVEEFKNFAFKGSVVDLAVGVIIGAAFGAIIKSMVEDIITPLIAMAGGAPDFSNLRVAGTPIMIGKFINALVNFLIQATVVYFFIVVPINKLIERIHKDEPKALPDDIKLLTEIRDLLKAREPGAGGAASPASVPGPT